MTPRTRVVTPGIKGARSHHHAKGRLSWSEQSLRWIAKGTREVEDATETKAAVWTSIIYSFYISFWRPSVVHSSSISVCLMRGHFSYLWHLPEPESFCDWAQEVLSWPTGWMIEPVTKRVNRGEKQVCQRKIIQERALPTKRRKRCGTHGWRASLNLDSLFLWPCASSLGLPVAIKQKKTSTALWIAPQSY